MKRLTTIICSLAFMVAGIFIMYNGKTASHKQLHAATPPPVATPLPLDLQLDIAKRFNKGPEVIRDTITVVHHDTVPVVKYKVKYRAPKKSVEPDTLPTQIHDTLYVPSLKVKMQMGEKELMDTIITLGPALCV